MGKFERMAFIKVILPSKEVVGLPSGKSFPASNRDRVPEILNPRRTT